MKTAKSFVLRKNSQVENNSKLSEKSKQRLKKSKAYNTIKAYESDWNDFSNWCMYHGKNDLPAEPEVIVNYINDLADDAKANTVSRRVSAISENHIAAGFVAKNPAHDGLVRNTLMAIRREKGTFQRGKAPILMEDIEKLSNCFDETDIVSLRDRALIYIGFAGAFRRSELVHIQMEELTFSVEGLTILVPQSKGDQLGRGSYIAIPYAPTSLICPVVAVQQWILAAQLQTGPLFRPFKRNKELRDTQLSDKSVALIIKKYMGMIGMNPVDFAGHSLRRGFATSAAQHDIDALTIMRQTRHKSEKMVHRYIEQGNIFKQNPLNNMYKK